MPEPITDVHLGKVTSALVSHRWTDVIFDEIAGKKLLRITYQRPPTNEFESEMVGAVGIPWYEMVYMDEDQAKELLRVALSQKEYGNAKLLDEALKRLNAPQTERVLSEASGSLRLVVPTEIASYMNVKSGDKIRFNVQGGKVTMEPVKEETGT